MKVAVVIPMYNAEKWIESCLESLRTQTRKPDKIIIVDDGSTDKSIEVVEHYILNHNNDFPPDECDVLIEPSEKNEGIAVTRNKGIKIALEYNEVDYICFLSSDDRYEPTYIEDMLKIADSETILYSAYSGIDENGKLMYNFVPPKFECYDDFILAVYASAIRNTMFINYSTTFFPAKLLKENTFNESMGMCEDLDHLLRLSLVKRIKFNYTEKLLVKYMVHSGSTTSQRGTDIAKINKETFIRINNLMGADIFEI